MTDDRYAAVRTRAYQRWEQEGRPEGRDVEYWLDAERDVTDVQAPDVGRQGISNHPPDEERQEQQSLPPRSTRKEDGGRGARSASNQGDGVR